MRNFLMKGCACALLAGTAGCALMCTPERTAVVEYDLGTAKTSPVSSGAVDFGTFRNISGAGARILYREKDGTLTQGEGMRFIILPEQLIKRRMLELFPGSCDENSPRVDAMLCRFEIDRRSSAARMSMEYSVTVGGRSKFFRHVLEAPVGGKNRNAEVAALEECVIKSARRLAGEISAFVKSVSPAAEKKQ